MKPLPRLLLFATLFLTAFSFAAAQDIVPPVPQKLVVHSNLLNEDRVIWVRTPHGYEQGKLPYPVLYLTDGPGHINEVGSIVDFLVNHNRMPPLIVVGIANTDRTRDLTPTHSDDKDSAGKETVPTSGGADRFLDFIQTELIPEIDKRYRTAPFRVFSGHSLGGLLAIHILITRPDLFGAYIAVSPSLWWDHQHTLHQAQEFFAARTELNKEVFFSLGNEGTDMAEPFDEFQEMLTAKAPKGFHWSSERYRDEDHGSTTMRAHYAGLRAVFADWQTPSEKGIPVGGLEGVQKHYAELSRRYGYQVLVPENLLNGMGYQLMGDKKFDEAIAVFQRNVELYPASANVYDSLGEGYENAGKFDLAMQNVQKAINLAVKTNDSNLDSFQDHLKRVTASAKVGAGKPVGQK